MRGFPLLVTALLAATALAGCGGGDAGPNPVAVMTTSLGVIQLELFMDKTPKTAENFRKLAADGFYDGNRFHRVIVDFMIQDGDPNSKDPANKDKGVPDGWGFGGPGYQIQDEFDPDLRHNKAGLLSMANSGPNTGGSQFFITLVPTPWLDDKHAIFGEVVEGMDVVDAIGAVETDSGDRPVEDVLIQSVTIES